jgi:hypothetical protein
MREIELENFYKDSKRIAKNKHYTGVDILSCIGDAANKYDITSTELRNLIDTKQPYWANYLEVIYDETVEMEFDSTVDKAQFIKDKVDKLSVKDLNEIYNIIKNR